MPASNGEHKVCSKCKQIKPINEFSKCKSRKDGYSYSCKSCEQVRVSLYKSKNKEKIKDEYRKYYETHKEQEKARVKQWSQLPENKSKNCEKVKRYYNTHKEYVDNSRKVYRQSNAGKVKVIQYNHTRRTRTLQTVNDLCLKDIELLLQIQGNKCCCCGRHFSKELRYTVDHIIPVKFGGGLTLKNTQLLCQTCNSSKGAKIIRYIPDLHLYGG